MVLRREVKYFGAPTNFSDSNPVESKNFVDVSSVPVESFELRRMEVDVGVQVGVVVVDLSRLAVAILKVVVVVVLNVVVISSIFKGRSRILVSPHSEDTRSDGEQGRPVHASRTFRGRGAGDHGVARAGRLLQQDHSQVHLILKIPP